jgi:predicted metal-dependent hydrolase
MEIRWNSGRYINIYEIEMDTKNRDALMVELRKNDPYVYDLRVESHRIELSYFYHINRKTIKRMGTNFFTSRIDFLQGATSFDFALYLINDERYWEAHEVLENQWQASKGVERATYQYIILLCVAGVHMQRGHIEISRNVIERANKLKTSDTINNIDIASIKMEKSLNPFIPLNQLMHCFDYRNIWK